MQQVRALDTRSLQNDGGEEKRRRLQLRTVFTEKGKLKNRGAKPLCFFMCGLLRNGIKAVPYGERHSGIEEGECPTRR